MYLLIKCDQPLGNKGFLFWRGGGDSLSHSVHNREIVGANPTPATIKTKLTQLKGNKMKYLLKANHNLLLPDGKTTIKVGEKFEWDGELRIFGTCVEVLEEIKTSQEPKKMTATEIRKLAKEMKIPNYSRLSVEELEKKINEANAPVNGPDPEKEPEQDPEKEPETQPTDGEAQNVGE